MAWLSKPGSHFLRDALLGGFLVLAPVMPASAQVALSGEKLFAGQCAACHSLVAGETRIGPSLYKIAGRKAGTHPGFTYSPALKAAKLKWTAANLDNWLTDTGHFIPGSVMNYRQADAGKRAAIIAWLLDAKTK